jgi:hypothetical protein
MESGIYSGTLRHRRFSPVRRDFTYPLFMVFLDIDRLPELMRVSPLAGYNRRNWVSYQERDHFGNAAKPLRERLSLDAIKKGAALPEGRIFLLTHLRYLGYNFNPVSFFYCYDQQDKFANGHGRGQQYLWRDRKLLAHAQCRAPGRRQQAVPIFEDISRVALPEAGPGIRLDIYSARRATDHSERQL